MKIDQDFLAWESLFLRLAAQWAFDEVLPSAALRHQVVLRLLDPEIRRGHDGMFARRILENALRRKRNTRKHLATLPLSHATQKIIGVMHAVTQGFDANVAQHVKKGKHSIQNPWFRPMIFERDAA